MGIADVKDAEASDQMTSETLAGTTHTNDITQNLFVCNK